MTFRELRAACSDMSPSVLNQRLAELRDALIVEAVDEGYTLTDKGRELTATAPLGRGLGQVLARLKGLGPIAEGLGLQ